MFNSLKYIITVFCAVVFLSITAQAQILEKFTDYLKVTVVNNNNLLHGDESQRFLETMIDYSVRVAKDKACDPRTNSRRPYPSGSSAPLRCVNSSTPAPTNMQFKTKWDPLRHRYEIGYLRGAKRNFRTVRLALLREENGGWKQDEGYSCKWTINEIEIDGFKPCRFFQTELEIGTHTAEVRVFKDGKIHYVSSPQSFEVKDFLIVAMGDSFGSGEGNPHTYIVSQDDVDNRKMFYPKPAMWLEPRCHRSLFSSSGLTTALLADANKDSSFSLINTACSGAESSYGLTKRYHGRQTANQSMTLWTQTTNNGGPSENLALDEGFLGFDKTQKGTKPRATKKVPAPLDIISQVDQLSEALNCGGKPCRKPDAILIYIGVNDIQFTNQLISLILGCDKKPACLKEQEEKVATGIDSIKTHLKDFKQKLEEREIAPENQKHIYLVTYPNPMTKAGDASTRWKFCGDDKLFDRRDDQAILGTFGKVFGLTISATGAEWAQDNILKPLNASIRTFANANGWAVIETEDSMLGHGYCSDKRFFNTFHDSQKKQGSIPSDYLVNTADFISDTPPADYEGKLSLPVPTGTMHPNYFGHRQVASLIIQQLKADHGLNFK